MVDRTNRKIEYLRISITDRCNLRCVYCMPEEGVPAFRHKDILSYEEILRVVRVAVRAGIRKVRVTGGEPLVRKEAVKLISSLAAVSGIEDLALTTNGVMLGRMAEELRLAGVKRINISLDSLVPERFEKLTRHGELASVLEGLEKAEAAGFSPIKINMVPIRGLNADEIPDFARMTLLKPFHVRFIEFMPIGARAMWDESGVVKAGEAMEAISALGPLEPVESGEYDGPARYFRLPGAKGLVGFISPLSAHFCGSCNRLRLTADGKLRPCLFSESEIDLKTPMRSGCDDDELTRLLGVALDIKPEGHLMAQGVQETYRRTMSKIGG